LEKPFWSELYNVRITNQIPDQARDKAWKKRNLT
jgi:hypothetical protein